MHRSLQQQRCTSMKSVFDIDKEKIYAAKLFIKQLGGVNGHSEQCDFIPSEIDQGKHGINLELCFKKFVRILNNKNKVSDDPECSNDPTENQPRPKRPKYTDFNLGVKLKSRVQAAFEDKPYFLSLNHKTP